MSKNNKERNNSNIIFTVIVIVVVVIMIGIIYFANNSINSVSNVTNKLVSFDNKKVSPSVVSKLENVSLSNIKSALSSKSSATSVTPITGEPSIEKDNLPRIIYVGADFCPFCAEERWALVIALSKFGTLNTLHYMTSSAIDVYPSTPTFTFYKFSYSSGYISFTPTETATNVPSQGGYTPLQTPTSIENSIFSKFDSYPYIAKSSAGSIPFIDIGNKGLIVGAQYSPATLKGMNWTSIINTIYNKPTSSLSVKILSSAGRIIQSICQITNGKPQNVCSKI